MEIVQIYKGCKTAKSCCENCYDSPYDTHSVPLLKELGWLTIKQLIHTETAKIVYKAFHNEASEYIKELFHRLSDTQNRELRSSKTDLHIPLLKTQ